MGSIWEVISSLWARSLFSSVYPPSEFCLVESMNGPEFFALNVQLRLISHQPFVTPGGNAVGWTAIAIIPTILSYLSQVAIQPPVFGTCGLRHKCMRFPVTPTPSPAFSAKHRNLKLSQVEFTEVMNRAERYCNPDRSISRLYVRNLLMRDAKWLRRWAINPLRWSVLTSPLFDFPPFLLNSSLSLSPPPSYHSLLLLWYLAHA